MILKFHMQHNNSVGLLKNEIQATPESNMAAVAKNGYTT